MKRTLHDFSVELLSMIAEEVAKLNPDQRPIEQEVKKNESDTGKGRDMDDEALDTSEGRDMYDDDSDTSDGRDMDDEASDTSDGRDMDDDDSDTREDRDMDDEDSILSDSGSFSIDQEHHEARDSQRLGYTLLSLRKTCWGFRNVCQRIIVRHLRESDGKFFSTISVGYNVQQVQVVAAVCKSRDFRKFITQINFHLDGRETGMSPTDTGPSVSSYRRPMGATQVSEIRPGQLGEISRLVEISEPDLVRDLRLCLEQFENITSLNILGGPMRRRREIPVDHVYRPGVAKAFRLLTQGVMAALEGKIDSLQALQYSALMPLWSWMQPKPAPLGSVLKNLTRLNLTLSTGYAVEPWNFFLAQAINLERLEVTGREGPYQLVGPTDSAITGALLNGQKWPRLRSFSLKNWIFDGDSLLDFFFDSISLKEVEMHCNVLGQYTLWSDFVHSVRDLLDLEKAEIVIWESEAYNDRDLWRIFRSHGTVVPSGRSRREILDVGAFVLDKDD